MAWTKKQSTNLTADASAATIAVAYPSNVSVGSLLILAVWFGDNLDAAGSVTDTLGNTWNARQFIGDGTNSEGGKIFDRKFWRRLPRIFPKCSPALAKASSVSWGRGATFSLAETLREWGNHNSSHHFFGSISSPF